MDIDLSTKSKKKTTLKIEEENCFLSSIVGCIALSVYKVVNKTPEGILLNKEKLIKAGVTDAPYKYIREFGSFAGIEKLLKQFTDSDTFQMSSG